MLGSALSYVQVQDHFCGCLSITIRCVIVDNASMSHDSFESRVPQYLKNLAAKHAIWLQQCIDENNKRRRERESERDAYQPPTSRPRLAVHKELNSPPPPTSGACDIDASTFASVGTAQEPVLRTTITTEVA